VARDEACFCRRFYLTSVSMIREEHPYYIYKPLHPYYNITHMHLWSEKDVHTICTRQDRLHLTNAPLRMRDLWDYSTWVHL